MTEAARAPYMRRRTTTGSRTSPMRWAASFVVVSTLLSADLGSKALATRFPDVPLVDPAANDELMLGLADLPVGVLVVISTLVVVAGSFGASILIRRQQMSWWVLPVGVAGFLGNVIDRIASGEVRDWLIVGPTRWNLADVFLLAAIVTVVASGIAHVRSGQTDRPDEQREEVRHR